MIRRYLIGLIAFAALSIGTTGSALADTPQSGSLTITSEPDDWVSQSAGTRTFAPEDTLSIGGSRSTGHRVFAANVTEFWDLSFKPPTGQLLTPGVYSNAAATPDATHAGLSISRMGRACQSLASASFEIVSAEYAAHGQLSKLALNFTQQCVGSTGTLSGSMSVVMPPEPVMTYTLTGLQNGYVGREPFVIGTFSCPPTGGGVAIDGTLTQGSLSAKFNASIGGCAAGYTSPWMAQMFSRPAFIPGPATITATLMLNGGYTTTLTKTVTFVRYPGRAIYTGYRFPGPLKLTLTRRGKIVTRLSCSMADGDCTGVMKVHGKIGTKVMIFGKRSYRVARGTTVSLPIQLTTVAQTAIRRARRGGTLELLTNGWGPGYARPIYITMMPPK